MDGGSDRKIAAGLAAGLAVFLLIYAITGGVCIYYMVRLQQNESEKGVARLIAIHPELESELIGMAMDTGGPSGEELDDAAAYLREKYQYRPEEFANGSEFMAAGLIWLGIGGVCLGGLGIFGTGMVKKERHGEKKELERLEECLQKFSQGNYTVSEKPDRDGYGGIWERIRELGAFCEAQKEKTALEEQNTKALITDISHQLKTPLASLKMSCELARSEKTDDKDREMFQAQCTEEIEKLEELLHIFVQLSRLENGMIRLRPKKRNIRDAVTAAVNAVIMQACRKRINISLEMPEEMEGIYDARWTEEAFTNLLDNAVKYSPDDTEVKIRVSGLAHYCMIEIEDEGIGIAREEYHRVFQRFYRGVKVRKSGIEGAGVGLYLARSIIEQQGGVIRIRQKHGEGSIFQILLPKEEGRG